MKQHPPSDGKPFKVLQEIDLVTLHADSINGHDELMTATRKSIAGVFRDFLAAKGFSDDRISVTDGFLFVFNDLKYQEWHGLNWWDQRQRILVLKDNRLYAERAQALLLQSCFAPYVSYTDEMVAKSTDQEVKHAWMRKRLVMKEAFWNTIDSISHAAYYQQKYRAMFPALCLLLCNFTDKNGLVTELFLGIDNGTGSLYKKKSRDSGLIRLLYKSFKFFFRSGVFYIGGMELGLQETDSWLSCHGSGAVVYQGWQENSLQNIN